MRFVEVLAIALIPFGELAPLLDSHNPWRGSESQDSIAWIVRAEKRERAPGSKSCREWIEGLKELPGDTSPYDPRLEGWTPWRNAELEMISDCEGSPCDIKVNQAEAQQIAQAPIDARLSKFLSLVAARVKLYLKDGKRPPTESTATLKDPWAEFARRGLKTSLALPAKPVLLTRILNVAPKELKPIRQVLDRRVAIGAHEGVLWVKDVYSNHHLDLWAEWVRVDCGAAESNEVLLLQGLLIESDQLKKNDLFSLLGRSKIRSAMKEHGARYLDQQAARLLSRPGPSPQPRASARSLPDSPKR